MFVTNKGIAEHMKTKSQVRAIGLIVRIFRMRSEEVIVELVGDEPVNGNVVIIPFLKHLGTWDPSPQSSFIFCLQDTLLVRVQQHVNVFCVSIPVLKQPQPSKGEVPFHIKRPL